MPDLPQPRIAPDKTRSMKKILIPILGACGLAVSTPCAVAELYAYDGFDYFANTAEGATLVGKNPALHSSGSIGLAGTTAGASAANQGGLSNVFRATGLTFGALHIRGGAARYDNDAGQASFFGFNYSGATLSAGGTLYTSYLVRSLSPINDASVVSLRLNTSKTAGAGTSYFVTYADSGATGSPPGAQYDNTSTTSGAPIQANTTYIVIGRFTNIGMTTGTREAATYILNAAQFANHADGGFGETEWDAATIGTGENQIVARVKENYTGSASFNLATNNGIQFGIGNAGSNGGFGQDVIFDELRCASTLGEVLPTGPQVDPVPVSLTATTPVATEPTAAVPAIGRITVSRLDASTRPVTVHLGISGTATHGADTWLIPSSATILENASSAVIDVRPLGDRRTEPDETLTLTLQAHPGGYVPASPDNATVTIRDGPFIPSPATRLVSKLEEGISQRVVVYGTSLTAGNLWPPQLKAAFDSSYPGQVTLINSGGSGENSVWGLANLTSKVINQNPDTVFIEFAVNDAVIRENYANRINPAQSRANLNTMIDRILASLPNCEIILQVMNPVIGDSAAYRPNLALCQQIYREVGKERGLLVIDHMPAWQALLDQGTSAFTAYVSDGLHPGAAGYARFVTPVILREIGAAHNTPEDTVMLHATNHRTAEPLSTGGTARGTRVTITRNGYTDLPLSVPLAFGGTSSGGDYSALPASVTIPAGSSSASFEMIPLADNTAEGEETFTVALAAGSGYTSASPDKASLIIEDLPFDAWRKSNFTAPELADPSVSGDKADPDHDGIPNLVEFFSNQPPKSPDFPGTIVSGTETIGNQTHLTLSYTRVLRTGLTGFTQTSENLEDWHDGTTFIGETILSDDGLLQTIKSRSLAPIGTGKEFLRLKVVREP